jgi:DNA-binding NarL/FixJ family response regulator
VRTGLQLVTLDLLMPDSPKFTSKGLFQAIRSEAPQTTILMISTQSRISNASSFLAAGAIGYIEKSFMNFDEVRKKLQAIFPEIKPDQGPARPCPTTDAFRCA